MPLEDIVSVTITSTTVTPTRESFGIALLMAQKVPAAFINRVYEFRKPSELTDMGFSVTDPAYLGAQKYFSQEPRPKSLKIGKRLLGTTQSIRLTCLSATTGDVYAITITNLATGVSTDISYTVPGSSTTTTVATAIAALIDAVTGFDATSSVANITCTATAGAGVLQNYADWTANFELKDLSADPGIATDLAAVQAADPNWYGLALDSSSKAEVVAAAAFAQANKKFFPARTCDTEVSTNTASNIQKTLKASSYSRAGCIVTQNNLMGFADMGEMGDEFSRTPGTYTMKFKVLEGIEADLWSSTQYANIKADRGNVITDVAGIVMLEEGQFASGRYFDSVRGEDNLVSTIKTNVFALLASLPKVPYTDNGVAAVVSVIKATLMDEVKRGYLRADPAPVVTAPKVADISSVDRGNRLLPDIEFSCQEAGAVHGVVIQGVVSV